MTATYTSTYSIADIETVMKRFRADLAMIAESTGTFSKAQVNEYVCDVETLAKQGYLAFVDVTLLSGSTEMRAARYEVNTDASDLIPSRSGGVLWPRVMLPQLRIVISYTQKWRDLSLDQQTAFKGRLLTRWIPSYADLSHSALTSQSTRNFVSNSYGLARKDYV